ncbi:2OG-Fe(II) oxygenase [Xanthocytophaga agilis]|uniref:2OG-Fe(II) oxygenase n=1 Tax=Xanthocytophaga agilis TaxID=3048010 RepID=A0AAE3R6B1_9BACT|nr:2OG-Fe(II) oxygenase [Xanthocytophaga agilis]MDJ1504441.1 2OG-Fe(II) oxygenase [Xanthocytophaga agilis]
MQATAHTSSIWTIDNFLSVQECDDLIAFSEKTGYDEAEVSLSSGSQMMKSLRNNYRLIYTDEILAQQLWEKIKNYVPEQIEDSQAIGLNEQFRFYRYENDQRFKRHIDGRFHRNDQEESRITFMIYLNDNFTGGETAFDNISILPVKGKALCFIHEQKHEGSPVTSGIKYVLRSDVMYKRI